MIKILEYLNEHYSASSTKGYENMINKYRAYMQSKAQRANYHDIMGYVSYLRKSNLHPKSLRNHLFAIKIYYRYLVEMEVRKDHPCEKLYLRDQINRSIEIENLYTTEQLENLLKEHRSNDKKNQTRDEIIIGLLIYQALTVRELVNLKITDINLIEANVHIGGSKKNNARTLALKANQILLISDYIREHQEQIYLFENKKGQASSPGQINRIINYKKNKREKLLPIKIRQSVIANYLKQNNDIRVVQVFAGHKRSGSTEEYKQSGLEELKVSISKIHPLQ
ncbi:MAG: tyrosine-type recombinase/integrase [Saprospiraceae bacterium]|nr:tyrosine-type recombinase/integrase [Candidatus Vicinibacter affinis]HQV64985.1 tyrosine-type recombinase/integrase [Candidatus Paceibacterota bacterium]HQW71450.1 tyrosine-type recombinase/integrase [Saprospiraceae bacterium]MBK7696562.1 tyrosine-type recombinase/integrase [Candidatus Vicinibacter affinis]MBK7800645.1 tyrosine-type recombinase/integrase [Candidatus Vicinibacter affinis]